MVYTVGCVSHYPKAVRMNYTFNVASAIWLLLPPVEIPGRKSARAMLDFCVPFRKQKSPLSYWLLLARGRETWSLGLR